MVICGAGANYSLGLTFLHAISPQLYGFYARVNYLARRFFTAYVFIFMAFPGKSRVKSSPHSIGMTV